MKEIATGYLRVSISYKGNPIGNAYIRCCRVEKQQIVYEDFFISDAYGNTPTIALYAPKQAYSLSPVSTNKPYETYMIEIRRHDFFAVKIEDIQIFANEHSFLPIELEKNSTNTNVPIAITKIPVHLLFHTYGGRKQRTTSCFPLCNDLLRHVIVPPYVYIHKTTHPKDRIFNVPFLYYLKNIACSHLYPTWPNEALCANIWILLFSIIHEVNAFWHQDSKLLFHINDPTFILNRNLHQRICTAVEDTFQVFLHKVYKTENFSFDTFHSFQTKDPWSIFDAVNIGATVDEIVTALGYPCMKVTTTQIASTLLENTFQVHTLQEQINSIAKCYEQISSVPITNVIDRNTQNAVCDIQRLLGLPIDGIVHDTLYTLIMQFADECKQLKKGLP